MTERLDGVPASSHVATASHEEKSERSFDASPAKLGGRTEFEHVSAERLCKAQEPC